MGPKNWSEMAGPPGTTVKLCMREPSPAPGPPSSSLHPHSTLLQARLSLDHAVPGPASSQGLSPLVPDLPYGPPCHPGPLPPAFPSVSTPFLPFPKHTLSVPVSYIPLLPPYLPAGPDKSYPGPPSQNSLTTPGLHLPRKLTVPHTALQMTKHSESGMHLLLALQNPSLPSPLLCSGLYAPWIFASLLLLPQEMPTTTCHCGAMQLRPQFRARVMETNLFHLLAQAREDDVTKGICWHLLDMFLWVPPCALEGVGLDCLLQVLLTRVAALTHHLPAKTQHQSPRECGALPAPCGGIGGGPVESRNIPPPSKNRAPAPSSRGGGRRSLMVSWNSSHPQQ